MASGVSSDGIDSDRMKRSMKRAQESERMVEGIESTRRHRPTQTRKKVEVANNVVAIPRPNTRGQHRSQTGSVFIHFAGDVKNVQIGNNNNMLISNTSATQASAQSENNDIPTLTKQQRKNYVELLGCSEEVSNEMMIDLAQSWNRKWRSNGRNLGLTDECLENISDNYLSNGIVEVCYQVLKSWKEQSDDLSVCNLIRLLTVDHDYKSIMVLLGDK